MWYSYREAGTGMQLQSTLTCPKCSYQAVETMPTDACQFFYECKGCGERLKPLTGDCCVFVSTDPDQLALLRAKGSLIAPTPKTRERGGWILSCTVAGASERSARNAPKPRSSFDDAPCSARHAGAFDMRSTPCAPATPIKRATEARSILLDPKLPFGDMADHGIHNGGPMVFDPCACRKSNPDILVMQAAEDWAAKNTPCPLNSTR
jgi:hypothetical protein